MKWWQKALIIGYHLLFAYAMASHINGRSIF